MNKTFNNVHNSESQIAGFIKESMLKVRVLAQPSGLAKSIKAGEEITIKSSYIRKSGLPFDNRGYTFSVMALVI